MRACLTIAALLWIALPPAPAHADDRFELCVPVLEECSSGQPEFEVVLGREVVFRITASPAVPVVVAVSPRTACPPRLIGGVPLVVDPDAAILLADGRRDPGAMTGPDGTYSLAVEIPGTSRPGRTFHAQAALLDPEDPRLLTGLQLTVVEARVFDFEDDLQGWSVDFTDYPVGEEELYELAWGRASLPLPLPEERQALAVRGNNHSDDLFMFLKRKLSGLEPGRSYRVLVEADLASKYPETSSGIGGSPGGSVYFKAGATTIEPVKVEEDGYYQLNLDKGNQGEGGADLHVLGTIGIPGEEFVWTSIRRDNRGTPFLATAGPGGDLWISMGTDSGHEGITLLYYDRIVIKLY